MGRAFAGAYPWAAMKNHITRHLLVLIAGASLACAADRVIPSDPGAGSGNAGAAGAGTTGQNMNPPAENNPARANRMGTMGDTGPGALSTTTDNSTLARGDQHFFEKITRLNEREIALSRHAAERATNAQVRSFANEMVEAHTEAGQELGTLATRKGARASSMDSHDMHGADKTRKIEKDWADKKGGDYDEAYIKAMIDAHEDTVDTLENGAESKDPEIAAAAQKLLPKVKAHLERAKQLKKSVD